MGETDPFRASRNGVLSLESGLNSSFLTFFEVFLGGGPPSGEPRGTLLCAVMIPGEALWNAAMCVKVYPLLFSLKRH